MKEFAAQAGLTLLLYLYSLGKSVWGDLLPKDKNPDILMHGKHLQLMTLVRFTLYRATGSLL